MVPQRGLGGPLIERMCLGNLQTICSIILQKCMYEAAGCNKSACVYVRI